MRLVLVGPPGAGKGTQAQFIAKARAIPAISTGDIFRANVSGGTELGVLAKSYMDSGSLVPDEVTISMVRSRLAEPDTANGFLLDGFPRTIPQAETLDQMLKEAATPLDAVLELVVDTEEVVRRLAGRRGCRACSRIWQIEFDPYDPAQCPRTTGLCDLYQRDDDRPEVVTDRLKIYERDTAPIVGYYEPQGILVKIAASGPVDEVTGRALAGLEKLSPA